MPQVVLVDTCVFLNMLDVPGYNQDRDATLAEAARLARDTDVSLLLPLAAIIETGNHIARLPDGRVRREVADRFCDEVCHAIDGESPWRATQALDVLELRQWIGDYPDHAMREISLADMSIIKEWEAACSRHPYHRVRIWSIDGELVAYDRAV